MRGEASPGQRRGIAKGDLLATAAILGLALLGYVRSFHGAFVFDDLPSIEFNRAIHGLRAFLDGGHATRPNREVAYLTFALNWELGGPDPTGYHVVNFCIHVVNALLVYALVALTFRTPRLRGSSLASSRRAVAFAAAALFVAHPIQTQAVTYIVQRLASLATTFYVLAVVLYVRWRLREPGPRWARALGYVPILFSALLAMRTKEIAFTLPLAVALWELAFFEGRPAERIARLAPLLATLAVIPLAMLGAASPAGDVLSDVSSATRVQTGMSRIAYLRTELAVVATYLRLLLLPVGQSVDHDYPQALSFLEPRVAWGLVVVVALIALALALLRASSPGRTARRLDPAARLVAAGILWFFLALAVESSVIPIVDVINEHRVYLPSVGFFTAAAAAAGLLAQRVQRRAPARAVTIGAAVLCAALALATLRRNDVWVDQLSLWSDAAAKSPLKSRPQNGVAVALMDLGRLREAEGYGTAAVRLDARNAEARYNLGRIYLMEGRYEEALQLFRAAIHLDRDYLDAYANMAGALNRLDRCAETVRILEELGPRIRDNPAAQFNLGVAYGSLGMREAARRQVALVRGLDAALAAQLDEFVSRR